MCGMDERPEQRPEGALIAAALKRSRMSQRQAAAKAGISENRLRAIVHGYQNVGAGSYVAVRGPADTVARIAHVAGVTPGQLEDVGRPDVANELRDLERPEPKRPATRHDRKMQLLEEIRQRVEELAGLDDQDSDRVAPDHDEDVG